LQQYIAVRRLASKTFPQFGPWQIIDGMSDFPASASVGVWQIIEPDPGDAAIRHVQSLDPADSARRICEATRGTNGGSSRFGGSNTVVYAAGGGGAYTASDPVYAGGSGGWSPIERETAGDARWLDSLSGDAARWQPGDPIL